ncbi:IQ domain-containing protein H-like isoform X2 [Paramacrobiotus metropolitanus]|nr:IQ domain-containing protein H-like isoform X2 [Paramacrobiotus metropolitanus]
MRKVKIGKHSSDSTHDHDQHLQGVSFGFRPVTKGGHNQQFPKKEVADLNRNDAGAQLQIIPRNMLFSITKHLQPEILPNISLIHAEVSGNDTAFAQLLAAFPDYHVRIKTVMTALRSFLLLYNIPLAVVDTVKLGELITTLGLREYFTKEHLLSLLDNRGEVEKLMKTAGCRFRGANGRIVAATVIQSNWRRYVTRRWYLTYRKQRAAANTISKIWLQWMRTKAIREKVSFTRETSRMFYAEKLEWLKANWTKFLDGNRLYIHLPSFGWEQNLRSRIKNFSIRENRQFGRIGDIHDSAVNVVYISPLVFAEQHADYQRRFLRLAAICNDLSEENLSHRLTMHVPALVDRFPAFHFCLSTILKYSGSSLHTLRQLAAQRPAVLVSGYPHVDDLEVAREIGVPYLGTDPYVADVYGTKSGALRVFREAGVTVPPGEEDIFSEQQLIESLSNLIVLNLETPTWIFKTNHSRDSRGIAWLHMTCISCLPFLRKERAKKKEQWSLYWAHEPFLSTLQNELREQLPKHFNIRSQSYYATWKDFVRDFITHGGVIQALPTADHVTCLTCDLFISPLGKMSVESSGDQIADKAPFSKLGYSIPQTSVAAQNFLIDYCEKIARTAYSRGIIGYVSVDFVTFFDGPEQILWALDWNIGIQDSVALSKVIRFVLNAWTSQTSLMLETFPYVPPSRRKRNLEAKELAPKPLRRFAVVSSALYHSHLEIIHPNVFYQICKSISLELDPSTKQGSILLPLDHSKKTMLGMCVIADSLHKALKIYSKNLKLMNEEITSTTIQGESNFITAATAMDNIANQVQGNDNQTTAKKSNSSFPFDKLYREC